MIFVFKGDEFDIFARLLFGAQMIVNKGYLYSN